MPVTQPIRYLKRRQIDTRAWNACVEGATNALIYARSFYLDALADDWDALVLNDYEAVMPLPWRKKWGLRYVYQVPFLQRLGVFGKNADAALIQRFYREAVCHFSLIHYKTDQPFAGTKGAVQPCDNFILPLLHSYDAIYENYTAECKKNLRKAESRGCRLTEVVTPETIIRLFRSAYGHLHTATGESDYYNFLRLIKTGTSEGFCKLYAVEDEKGEIVFAAVIFMDKQRIYYSLGAPTQKGRKLRATYFFVNELIKKYAGQKLWFDFEGSDLPNVAAFYQKFNPQTEVYFEVKINNMPLPLRWLKR